MDGRGHGHRKQRLSAYLDGGLEPAEAEELRGHLSDCASCRAVLADLERVRRWARDQPPIGPARDLWPEIHMAIRGGSADGEPAAADGPDRWEGPRPARSADAAGPGPGPKPPPVGRGRPAEDSADGRRRGVYVRIPQLVAAGILLLLLGAAGGAAVLGTGGALRLPFETGLAPGAERVGSGAGGEGALGLNPVPATGARVPAAAELEPLAREARQLQARLEAAADRLDPVTAEVLQRNLTVIDRAIREATEALAREPDDPYVREHLVRAWEQRTDVLRQVVDVASWQEAD